MEKQIYEEKVQPVLVYTDFTATGNKAVEWAVYMCEKMSRRLILLHVIDRNTYSLAGNTDPEIFARETISEIRGKIQISTTVKVSTHVEEGCNCTVISKVAEENDVIFSVVGVHARNDLQYLSGLTAIKMARRSRIPFLFVQEMTPTPHSLAKIAFPLNIQKQMKEKVSWGIFLAKHLHETVEIVLPENDDEVKTNLFFTAMLFEKLNVSFVQTKINGNIFNVENRALNYTEKNRLLLSVMLMLKGNSVMESFFGPRELKYVCNRQKMAVFMVNPRKDLYIPCI
ncbi:MAG TPA: universal stress protein [Bacteroidales bacterium]|nr:universal stress protein [Bacteroidales bacterium]HQP03482.1 universal stress protein [Bacteroidales bacterium]